MTSRQITRSTQLSALSVVSVTSQDNAVAGPAGAFATVNGARLWYRVEGNGEPVVLIAGGPGNSHTALLPQFLTLADSFRVVLFDAFGRGRSDRATSRSDYTLARDVSDLEGLRVALGLGAINVIGHSYGGIVAQAYALKHPSSVRRLVLSSTFHSGEMWQDGGNDTWNMEIRNQFPETWAKLQAIRRAGRLSGDAEYQALQGELPVSLWYYYDPSNASRPQYGGANINMDVYLQMMGDDPDVVLGGDMAKFDFRLELRRITAPMLITAGRFDRVAIPRFAVQFREHAPQADFVMFERSGHSPHREETDLYFGTLREFLRRPLRP